MLWGAAGPSRARDRRNRGSRVAVSAAPVVGAAEPGGCAASACGQPGSEGDPGPRPAWVSDVAAEPPGVCAGGRGVRDRPASWEQRPVGGRRRIGVWERVTWARPGAHVSGGSLSARGPWEAGCAGSLPAPWGRGACWRRGQTRCGAVPGRKPCAISGNHGGRRGCLSLRGVTSNGKCEVDRPWYLLRPRPVAVGLRVQL